MKNFISKLTFKKSNIITITISLLLSALSVLFFYLYLYPNFPKKLGLSIFVAAGFALFVYLIMYTIIGLGIFDLPEKEAKEKVIKNFNLTKDTYTKVDYDCSTGTEALLPFLMLVHSEYYFYVKLNENENLHLLVKTSKQDVIYNNTIRFAYFNAHFKKIN